MTRAEDGIDRREEKIGPLLDRANRGLAPVEGPGEIGHLSRSKNLVAPLIQIRILVGLIHWGRACNQGSFGGVDANFRRFPSRGQGISIETGSPKSQAGILNSLLDHFHHIELFAIRQGDSDGFDRDIAFQAVERDAGEG